MTTSRRKILERFAGLNVYRSGERRAPHKPLLCLVALAHLLNDGGTALPFEVVRAELRPLLDSYAPPVKARHQPELPYWHLQSDGVWQITGADSLPRQIGGFPRIAGLRGTTGGFAGPLRARLLADRALARDVALVLLRAFPDTLHAEILQAVGLPPEWAWASSDDVTAAPPERVADVRARRDPEFRRKVMHAYEHRCAATGFRAALAGSYFGVEAAHVQWHAQGGPDVVANGLVLNPLMHQLFDRGAWTLGDDRRIQVSAHFTGSDEAVTTVRALHGRPLRPPLPGMDPPAIEFIRWHREPDLGGVFRQPSLDVA